MLSFFVVRPGFEPRLNEPKSLVLPLYYRTIILSTHVLFCFDDANIRLFLFFAKLFLLNALSGLIFRRIFFVFP